MYAHLFSRECMRTQASRQRARQCTDSSRARAGAGKSTLLKLMTGELEALDGAVKRHNHLRIGVYHQHLAEKLNPEESPLEYMMREFGVRFASRQCAHSVRDMRMVARE